LLCWVYLPQTPPRTPHRPSNTCAPPSNQQSARALQLRPGQVKLADYEVAAKKFCGKSWDAIRKEFLKHSAGSDTYTLQVCFAAAHVLTILRDGLHLSGAAAGVLLANDVETHKGVKFTSTWTLGALVVEVLRIGSPDRGGPDDGPFGISPAAPAGVAAAGGYLPAAPKTDSGAAALAAAFCIGLIALMSALSRMRVGIIGPGGGPGDRLEKVRSGTPSDMEMQALLAPGPAIGGVGGVGGAGLLGEPGGCGGGGGGGGGGLMRDAHTVGGAARVSAQSSRRRGDGL
jgi:hypothetical protein